MSGIENIRDLVGIDLEGVKRTITDNSEKLEDRSGALTEYARDIRSATEELDYAVEKLNKLKVLLETIDDAVEEADNQADDAWNTALAFEIDN